MYIMTRWGFRMVRANGARTTRTILSVTAFFALLTGSRFITDALARAAEASGRGLYRIIEQIVFYSAIVLTVVMLFSVFSITVDECRQDEYNLTSAGATWRQILRSLLCCALALDLVGAVAGTAVGVLLSRLVLEETGVFRNELQAFFSLKVTYSILAGGLLVVPCTMLLAALYAHIPHRRKPRPSKRWLLRNTLERRVFGVGGTLGRLSSNKNLRYRAIFTLSFAAALTVSAILGDTMQLLSQMKLTETDADVTLEYMSAHDDASVDRKVDALLQTCRARGWIGKSTILHSSFLSSGYNCFCLLDCDRLTDDAQQAQIKTQRFNLHRSFLPFEQEGRQMLYCPLYNVVFLDDATFDRYAKSNGIDAGTDGTLLYSPDWLDKTSEQYLQTFSTPRNVALHFLPPTFEYRSARAQPDEADDSFDLVDYLQSADKVSVVQTVRLAGTVSEDPYPDGSLSYSFLPEWIVPKRLESKFAYIPKELGLSVPMTKTTVYLTATAHKEVCELFTSVLGSDPGCRLEKLHFGVGGTDLGDPSVNKSAKPNAATVLYLEDLREQQEDLDSFRENVPKLQTLLLLFSAGMLCIGIFNTAHMNRLTRRREKAILTSIGMGKRQKTGMLLYESTRYALHSTAYSLLGFAAYFLILYRLIPINMYTAHLDMRSDELYHALGVYILPELVNRSFLQTCGGSAWAVFAGGFVLIFLVLVVTDTLVDRFYDREELIQILTDDSQYLR